MKRPVARPVDRPEAPADAFRAPRAFTPERAEVVEVTFEPEPEAELIAPAPRRMGWLGRLAWTTGGLLVSAGLGLAADRLIRDLFAANEWLGWLGLGVLGAFLVLFPRAKLSGVLPIGCLVLPLRSRAYLFIPGWFALQIAGALLARPGSATAGVAWYAHLAGFAAGPPLAWLLRR